MNQSNHYPFQLLDVRLYEATMERLERDESEESAEVKPEAEDVTPISLVIDLDFREHSARQVSAFLNLDFKSSSEQVSAFRLCFTIEGLFTTLIDVEDIEEEIRREFKDLSAATLLWPYAREFTHNFVQRMRLDVPLLPTLNRLSTDFGDQEEDNSELSTGEVADSEQPQ